MFSIVEFSISQKGSGIGWGSALTPNSNSPANVTPRSVTSAPAVPRVSPTAGAKTTDSSPSQTTHLPTPPSLTEKQNVPWALSPPGDHPFPPVPPAHEMKSETRGELEHEREVNCYQRSDADFRIDNDDLEPHRENKHRQGESGYDFSDHMQRKQFQEHRRYWRSEAPRHDCNESTEHHLARSTQRDDDVLPWRTRSDCNGQRTYR